MPNATAAAVALLRLNDILSHFISSRQCGNGDYKMEEERERVVQGRVGSANPIPFYNSSHFICKFASAMRRDAMRCDFDSFVFVFQ